MLPFVLVRSVLTRHKINLFHVFHIQLLKYADSPCVFKAAAEGKIMDLFFVKVKTKLMKTCRHFYGAEKVRAVFSKSEKQGMSKTLVANCAKRSGFSRYTYLAQLPQMAERPAP